MDPAFPPVIIEVALNGVVATKASPAVPRTTAALIASAEACIAAGASIVHFHVSDASLVGERAAAAYLEIWQPVAERYPAALFYPTVAFVGSVTERFAHLELLAECGALRLGLVDPGSLNLGVADPRGVPLPLDLVYINSFRDIHHQLALCARHRLGPSISIFEPGFLRATRSFAAAGLLPTTGAMIKLYFGGDFGYLGSSPGVSFGLAPSRIALAAYRELLIGLDHPWMVAVMGGDVLATEIAEQAVDLGGHLRVGLEDYAGPEQPSNDTLVARAAALIRDRGRQVATAEQAAAILRLPPRT
ncbi:MAG: hypothetical protein H6Q90_11 [Deltaproteobacteria bacterium]|nr:hypothetical protein [Deltaproteobacteria bacterium]